MNFLVHQGRPCAELWRCLRSLKEEDEEEEEGEEEEEEELLLKSLRRAKGRSKLPTKECRLRPKSGVNCL